MKAIWILSLLIPCSVVNADEFDCLSEPVRTTQSRAIASRPSLVRGRLRSGEDVFLSLASPLRLSANEQLIMTDFDASQYQFDSRSSGSEDGLWRWECNGSSCRLVPNQQATGRPLFGRLRRR